MDLYVNGNETQFSKIELLDGNAQLSNVLQVFIVSEDNNFNINDSVSFDFFKGTIKYIEFIKNKDESTIILTCLDYCINLINSYADKNYQFEKGTNIATMLKIIGFSVKDNAGVSNVIEDEIFLKIGVNYADFFVELCTHLNVFLSCDDDLITINSYASGQTDYIIEHFEELKEETKETFNKIGTFSENNYNISNKWLYDIVSVGSGEPTKYVESKFLNSVNGLQIQALSLLSKEYREAQRSTFKIVDDFTTLQRANSKVVVEPYNYESYNIHEVQTIIEDGKKEMNITVERIYNNV